MQKGDRKIIIKENASINQLLEDHFAGQHVRLFCVGKELHTSPWGQEKTLKDYNIKHEMTVQVIVSQAGY
jgi:hypothetical protein